jgi:DMSO/TMAO reductase YedYZ molybdopterin-dependent catalytic subunit
MNKMNLVAALLLTFFTITHTGWIRPATPQSASDAPKTEVHEGGAIHDLLHRTGVPEGENFRGADMTTYVAAEGTDGYRLVFSLAELDPGTSDSEVMVADTMNGAPLDAKHGPFQLVVPHDKRAARSVRMLKSLTVGQVSK